MIITRLVPLTALALSLAACASPGQQTALLEQERRACAVTGFDPGGPQFDQCVGNLDESITELRNNNG